MAYHGSTTTIKNNPEYLDQLATIIQTRTAAMILANVSEGK